ncbi:Xenotropic and polytropic retrovirus receptor 1 [Exserohilum turcicum]
MNFHYTRSNVIYQYYPALLIGISVVLWLLPFKTCYHTSRMWLRRSLWRVCLAGLYRVEWWDIYIADMLCSLTYSTGNISLFFCLYARGWSGPNECDSSHSRALGFMTTLPSIWRALQCLRRYLDTSYGKIHLLNSGKYILSIPFYVTLSMYRICETMPNRWIFIALATVNSSVNGAWDICYDWGLGNAQAKYPFLRRELGFPCWLYYAAILVNILLRFTWILYVAVPQQLQHSAITSFGISVGEVCRRGLWSLFRIENEHYNRTSHLNNHEAPSHSSALFTELGPVAIQERCHSCVLKRSYQSLAYNHNDLTDGKQNRTSQCTSPAVPDCVFSASSSCNCDNTSSACWDNGKRTSKRS